MKHTPLLIVGILFFALLLNCNPASSKSSSTNTVTDIDGNVYHTVTIGTQTWTVENLKATKYNDGTAIPNITDNTTWGGLATGAYCWYNDSSTYKNTYGALYNWYAINTGKLAPTGWHVPTSADWDTLSAYLGGDDTAGGKLKETGTAHWLSPNAGATNETGFSALPGGCRDLNGSFGDIGSFCYLWSATELMATDAGTRSLSSDGYAIAKFNSYKQSGFSVRLLKD
jgi:uncharacterized protein (TIGR02145 family)